MHIFASFFLSQGYHIPTLADSGFLKNFLYQDGIRSTVSWVFEDLKPKISEDYNQNWCFPDSANWAESGKHQFGSKPSEILNLRSSNTQETVDSTPP